MKVVQVNKKNNSFNNRSNYKFKKQCKNRSKLYSKRKPNTVALNNRNCKNINHNNNFLFCSIADSNEENNNINNNYNDSNNNTIINNISILNDSTKKQKVSLLLEWDFEHPCEK
jgi:hypothetical protein